MRLSLYLLGALALLAVIAVVRAQAGSHTITPEPVTDEQVLRRLNCQMHCKNELEDDTPDCQFDCISSRCYRKVFKKLIKKGLIEGEISARLHDKFEECANLEWEREHRDEL